MTSSTSTAQRKKANERAKADRAISRTILSTLMKSGDGRRWLWLRLSDAGVFRTTYDDNSLRMAFAEGMRNSGLQLLADIHRYAAPFYAQMVTENASAPSTEGSTPPTEPEDETND